MLNQCGSSFNYEITARVLVDDRDFIAGLHGVQFFIQGFNLTFSIIRIE